MAGCVIFFSFVLGYTGIPMVRCVISSSLFWVHWYICFELHRTTELMLLYNHPDLCKKYLVIADGGIMLLCLRMLMLPMKIHLGRK